MNDKTSDLTAEQKAQLDWIERASIEELLRRWRFSPAGDPVFQGIVGKAYSERMFALQDKFPLEWTATSKRVGWSP